MLRNPGRTVEHRRAGAGRVTTPLATPLDRAGSRTPTHPFPGRTGGGAEHGRGKALARHRRRATREGDSMTAGAALRPVSPAAVDAHRTGDGISAEPRTTPVLHPIQLRRGGLGRSYPATVRQPGGARSGRRP